MFKFSIVYYFFLLFSKIISCAVFSRGMWFVYSSSSNVKELLLFVRDHLLFSFKILADVTCVDYVDRFCRFELVYSLLSTRYCVRLFLKASLAEHEHVPSVGSVFSNASPLEREVWDLFGVYFSDHLDLRRILTDYGFEGFPMRKDFPISGYTECAYSEISKKVVYAPLSMLQEFRYFSVPNPWAASNFSNARSYAAFVDSEFFSVKAALLSHIST